MYAVDSKGTNQTAVEQLSFQDMFSYDLAQHKYK